MLKIIHSKFQIDLSNYDISIIEENHWFADTFFTKYTLPFNLFITDELNAAMGDILSYTSDDANTYFEVYFYHNGTEYEAIFEIEEIQDREASCVISFGLEDLPNYNKKLSELPLDDFPIEAPETIYTHASDVIAKTWPEVSHNFVMVHTNKFDGDEAQWAFFEGTINKRVGSAFVVNEYDALEDLQLNCNIMIPQPYLLHVLQKGIEDAGFTLAGDVLEDPELKKALFSEISSYYSTVNVDSLSLFMHNQEFSFLIEHWVYRYSKTINLTEKGRYKIAGNITIRRHFFRVSADIKFNDQRVWYAVKDFDLSNGGYSEFTIPIDINVDFFEGATATIEFWSNNIPFTFFNNVYDDSEVPICDLTITQLSKFDAGGNLLPTLILPQEIKLTKCVPDMTFSDFVKILKNWKNLDLKPVDKVIYMDYIENQLEVSSAKDLRAFEVKTPIRRSNKGKSFLLKFQDVSSEDYIYEAVYVDVNGSSASGYTTQEDTSEIIINALPLPIATKSNIITAHHFIDDASKLKVILYEGAPAISNVAEAPINLLIPAIYQNHFLNWLSFRINSTYYKWNFKMFEENLRDLGITDKIFSYKNHHIIKTMNKDLIKPGIWLVELETESLKQTIQ